MAGRHVCAIHWPWHWRGLRLGTSVLPPASYKLKMTCILYADEKQLLLLHSGIYFLTPFFSGLGGGNGPNQSKKKRIERLGSWHLNHLVSLLREAYEKRTVHTSQSSVEGQSRLARVHSA